MAYKLDMIPLLNGSVDTLPFSFTFNANEANAADDANASDETGHVASPLFDGVTFSAPAEVRGCVTNRAGYILLTANATLPYETECARCLVPVTGTYSLSVEKPVAEEGSLSEDEEAQDDYLRIVDNRLDAVTPILDQLLMEFPLRFLCREDCRGLCSGCGADLNREACRCKKKEIDPRMAALAALLDSIPDDPEEDESAPHNPASDESKT